MKRILFLGAAAFQVPPIQYALNQGYYVITCDNVPGNPGHKLAQKSYNISTINMERILEVARHEKIDGILSFGSDVSAPTASYVAGKLGLPGNPFDAVCLLTNKARFRSFLNNSGLQPLPYFCFGEGDRKAVYDCIASMSLPLMIKPVDSSGSKGVSILTSLCKANEHINYAFEHSISKTIIIEKYIQKQGKQVCGDGFVINGEVVFTEFGDGHFYDDGMHLAPYAETFPGTQPMVYLDRVRQSLQAIISASGLTRGPFNLDVLITKSGDPFVIEIGPRSGGNFIPRAIYLNTGVDVTAGAVEACLQNEYKFPHIPPRNKNFYACYMVHSRTGGKLRRVSFAQEVSENLFETNWYLAPGEQVFPFLKANFAIGNVIFRFDSFAEMQMKMERINEYCAVELEL